MTQQNVIDHIKEHGSITSRQAQRKYGALNLASVIHNINKKGKVHIKQELRGRVSFDPNKGDKTVTHYVLEDGTV